MGELVNLAVKLAATERNYAELYQVVAALALTLDGIDLMPLRPEDRVKIEKAIRMLPVEVRT